MNKIFSILLALLYLGTSNGLALQVHYCMDEIAGLSLGNTEQKGCGSCGMEKGDNNCCKDELKFVKLNDSHKLQLSSYQVLPPVALLNHSFEYRTDNTSCPALLATQPAHAPPGNSPVALYLQYCVFRL